MVVEEEEGKVGIGGGGGMEAKEEDVEEREFVVVGLSSPWRPPALLIPPLGTYGLTGLGTFPRDPLTSPPAPMPPHSDKACMDTPPPPPPYTEEEEEV